MKYLLLSLISFSAIAQDASQFKRAFKVLSNPGEILETCADESTTPEPAWCSNLSKAICAIPKRSNTLATVSAQLDRLYMQPLNNLTDAKTKKKRRATASERANAQVRMIAEAERLVPTRTNVSQADLQTLFTETMTDLKASLQASTKISTAQKAQMIVALNNTKLITNIQYLADYAKELKAGNPGMTDLAAKQSALTDYEPYCGADGMIANAFNAGGKVVFCPGFIQSLADHGSAKDKLLTAIGATMAHEIGHSIDANVFPAVYTDFGTCQTANTTVPSYNWGVMKGEISADFWAAEVYGKRVAREGMTGQDALNNLAVATDDFCTIGGDATHPHAINRIDEYYGRNTQVRSNLGCTSAPAKPGCGL